MSGSIGVAIHRRAAALVVLDQDRGQARLLCRSTRGRASSDSVVSVLVSLLQEVPAEHRILPLRVALSAGDLAVAGAWTADPVIPASRLPRLAPSLCEARSVGETVETLAVDAIQRDGFVQAVALNRGLLEELRTASAGFRLELLTSIPEALARLQHPAVLTLAGERVEVAPGLRRSAPSDAPDDQSSWQWHGMEVPPSLVGALAAAATEPESVPDILAAKRRAPGSLLRRLRDPLINVAAAVILCLAAAAVHFHRLADRSRAEIKAAQAAELDLWERFLPGEIPKQGRLLKSMSERLADSGEGSDQSDIPSALSFWGEIGRQMPDPDAIGLTLESLDLAPDGGRISARLPAAQGDPLRPATQLEGLLNQSKKVSARGDYEVRDGQVQVRLRMNYRP